jgi:DNA-binding NarL/FixJ family response regulator
MTIMDTIVENGEFVVDTLLKSCYNRYLQTNIGAKTMTKAYRVLKLDEQATFKPATKSVEPVSKESDAEIIERMRERFDILEDMTRAVKKGEVRAMIVSGAPGVGKSFGVEKVLAPHALLSDIANDSKLKKFEIVKGAMSAIGLYKKLYEFSDRKCILVFDDCDSVLLDDIALNILKAALDTSKKRVISWNTDSRSLIAEGVPNSFEYKGGAIFITNINFQNIKSKKLQDHLAALESRCHYIDLTIHTERDKMLRIRQIVADGMLKDYEFSTEQEAELVEFIASNKARLRELSLRTVLKAADLIKSFPQRWQRVAEVSLMR